MHKPLPWFRFYHAEYQLQTRGMKSSEKGVYVDLLVVMHEWGEPIPENIQMLSRATSTTVSAFKNAFETLLARGAIFRTGDGRLWSTASQRQRDEQEKQSEQQREKSSKRWQKDEGNQRPEDAGAYRYKNREEDRDSDAHKEHRKSHTSPNSKGSENTVEDKAARDGAASPEVGQKITITAIGTCYVDKVLSNSPLVMIVTVSDWEEDISSACHWGRRSQS